ncbi:MAG: arginine--tRNA ligase [Betaproteobacteria bacterium]|nr:arginine--tRNA ligase [Betaproteobacteria bacterium]
MIELKLRLTDVLRDSVKQLCADAGLDAAALPAPVLERPKQAGHGDMASNAAMQLARPLKRNPRELAQWLIARVQADAGLAALLSGVEIAGPGFINFRASPAAKQGIVKLILRQGTAYGTSGAGAGKPVMVEFVSANPTGPLHLGHARQAALGDAIAALLATQGHAVTREFYYNDAGVQINTLAQSVQARCQGLKPGDAGWPESAYNGEYIADIAQDYLGRKTVHADDRQFTASGDAGDLDAIRQFAVAYLRHEQDLDLRAFGVRFDNYYLESSLYTEGRVDKTVAALIASGKTYEQDGALWLRTTDYGDDKDRVMRKSDGSYTYFVPDVAYHVTKWERGYTQVINCQGTDHHGTIARVRAGLQALGIGIPPGYPDYVLNTMVRVMRGGEEVKISKRAGGYVTLRDLITWCGDVDNGASIDMVRGKDAVRFFLVSRKADTEFTFDVDLALQQNDENPVYYIQYAHARACSILGSGNVEGAVLARADLSVLQAESELALLSVLADYPDMLARACADLTPHDVAFYLRELASTFHTFYNAERVLVDDPALRHARLALLSAVRQVLHNGLQVLGVSAPERM